MFERFTERSREVTVLAQEEARRVRHHYLGTEHLLLGLLREEEGLAAAVLTGLGFTVARTRDDLERIVGRGEEVISGQIPFTPRAKKVLELALREALSLGHNYIGTEHILLGLVRESEGVAARILTDRLGALYPEIIRGEIMGALGGPSSRRTREPRQPKPSWQELANAASGTLAAFLDAADGPERKRAAARGFDRLARTAQVAAALLRGDKP